MSQEVLDVVDDNDSVVDHQPRHIIHTERLKHRAVHILVFDDRGYLFLQKRSMQKDQNPGLWDTSAAGHVDAGEDYDHSAVRELAEELGVADAGNLEFLFKLGPTAATGMEFVQAYRFCHNGPFRLAPGEIDDGDWFNLIDIDERVSANDRHLTETFKRLWRNFRLIH